MKRAKITWMTLAAVLLMVGGCLEDPGFSDEQPLYRWDPDGQASSAERGTIMINEIGWAGSIDDQGNHDPDDVFIELLNKHPRNVNLSGWRLNFRGDYEKSLRIPHMNEPVPPNGYLVIAAKADGAFGEVADVILEDLQLGQRAVFIELRDSDQRLIESAGSRTERPYAGSYDLVTTRSMERAQVLFGNRGNENRSWHHNIDDARDGFDPERRTYIREGWRRYTLASPGRANSSDYAGATSSGGFE